MGSGIYSFNNGVKAFPFALISLQWIALQFSPNTQTKVITGYHNQSVVFIPNICCRFFLQVCNKLSCFQVLVCLPNPPQLSTHYKSHSILQWKWTSKQAMHLGPGMKRIRFSFGDNDNSIHLGRNRSKEILVSKMRNWGLLPHEI